MKPPARCFRRETDSSSGADESLRALAGNPTPVTPQVAREAVREERAPARPRKVWVVPVILLGALLGA
jgi:hypothetical protein